MSITCPECRATLELGNIDRDTLECPICSTSLEHVVDPRNISPLAGVTDEEDSSPQSSNTDFSPSDSGQDRLVEIIERSDSRLVAFLPPSTAGSGGLGAFVFIWNGILTAITCLAGITTLKQVPPPRIELLPILFLAFFWLIGIGILVCWVRMRFTRIYLLLEKGRLVVQRVLFKTTNREILLSPTSQATLVESYSSNDVPVYSVTVQGLGRQESFGTGLSPADKDFLTAEINSFLGVRVPSITTSAPSRNCPLCGERIEGDYVNSAALDDTSVNSRCAACREKAIDTVSQSDSVWAPLRGSDRTQLPESLEVEDLLPDHVTLRYPLFLETPNMNRMTRLLLLFACLWGGVVLYFGIKSVPPNPGITQLSFLGLSMLVKLVPALFIVGVRQVIILGRICIQVSTEWVTLSWGWGPMTKRKRITPESITDCRILRGNAALETSGQQTSTPVSVGEFAVIKAGGSLYPLVTSHGLEYGQLVIRLIRTAVQDLTGRAIPG